MFAFKSLKNASNKFEREILRVAADLDSASIGENFEDGMAEEMGALSLFSSKMRLLRAKSACGIPQLEKDEETTLNDYTEAAAKQLVHKQAEKALAQACAVEIIMAASNKMLEPELVETKEKIISSIDEYEYQEETLRHSENLLKEKKDELDAVRAEWEKEVGDLRDLRASVGGAKEDGSCDPLYNKLRDTVEKMELMRWLISTLGIPRTGGYDWIRDPHKRLTALKLAREPNTVEKFLQ